MASFVVQSRENTTGRKSSYQSANPFSQASRTTSGKDRWTVVEFYPYTYIIGILIVLFSVSSNIFKQQNNEVFVRYTQFEYVPTL